MLSKNHKRLILIIFDFLFSAFIWNVNASWGNIFLICLILSTTTFLIIFTPFEIYWSFRDIYLDRWKKLYLNDLSIEKLKIRVDHGFLGANLIKIKDQNKRESKNTIVIICHGFSDTMDKLQYYYLPLVYQGYTILTYDARGIGESKKLGKRSHFIERLEDYRRIIDWIINNKKLNDMRIYAIGFSIGAITVLNGSFVNTRIEKIIAISAISRFKQNLHRFNPLIIISYLLKGVKISTNPEENQLLSPYITIKNLKQTLSNELFNILSNRVLLIHTKNDNVIKFKNFQENVKILNSLPRNKLVFKKGGHIHKKNELSLVGASLNFLYS